jgi:hypothetical protein
MQRNNPRYKLDHSQVEEARRRYEDDGWKILWISVYFNVKNGNIHFHVKSKGWVRKVKVVKRMPEEVAEIYRKRKREKYDREFKGSYADVRNLENCRRNEHCEHSRWVKRCSLCGEIIGSDALEYCPPRSIEKII